MFGTPTASQHNLFDSEKSKVLLCSWRDSNSRLLDLQSNALTTEPTLHPYQTYTCVLWIELINLFYGVDKTHLGKAMYSSFKQAVVALSEPFLIFYKLNFRLTRSTFVLVDFVQGA